MAHADASAGPSRPAAGRRRIGRRGFPLVGGARLPVEWSDDGRRVDHLLPEGSPPRGPGLRRRCCAPRASTDVRPHPTTHRPGLSAVHQPGVPGDLRRRRRRTSPAPTAATCSTSSTTGTACPSRAGSREFEAKWSDRLDPLNFSGVWRFRELLPFAPPEMVVTIGEGQTLLQAADKVGQYVGMDPGGLRLQYEGMNPSGSFKDNGMTAAFTHARMVRARPGRLRQHGQHLGGPGRLLLGHRLRLQGDHLHRLGQDRLRQARPGARPRRPDDPDRRRLRRRHAARPPGRRPARHLPDELGQPVPPRRPEDDHVPGPRGAGLGAPRLDRRPRRQPRQLQRLRQGVHRAEAPRPDRPRPPPGRDQRRTAPGRSSSSSASTA